MNQQNPQMEELQQQLAQLDAAVRSKMSKEALSRFSNIKLAHPDKAVKLAIFLAQLLDAGKINIITDDLLKTMLSQLEQVKRATNIKVV